MKDYVLLTDATVDLPQSVLNELDVSAIGMPVLLDEQEYLFDIAQTQLTLSDFYRRVRGGEKASTALINAEMYRAFFRPFAEKGVDMLYIGFDSGLSGTYQQSLMAAKKIMSQYPDVRLLCVDSLSASVGQAALVHEAARMRQNGASFDELADWLEQNRLAVAHWFTVDDLHYLHRGGRLSKGSAVMGTALHLKPLLTIDRKGKLKPVAKLRGRRKAISHMAELTATHMLAPDSLVVIGHADDLESAESLKQAVLALAPSARVLMTEIGPVIGAHVGPGMLAVAYIGDLREDI